MQQKKKSKAPALVALAAIGALAALAWQFWLREKPVTYEIQTAQIGRGSIERSISATGSVQALVTADVSSQLSGQISQVNVDFNSPVHKGDILAAIDPRTFTSRVASADANLAIAKSNLEVQQAGIVKAEAIRDQAKRALERQKALIESRSTPAATLDQAQTQHDTAVADVEVARAQLSNARAAVTQKEAELAQAKLDLDRTQLKTPIDGVVIARNVEPGTTVAASLQAPVLFQIAQDLKQIEILVLVDEADIGAIEAGQSVTFTVDAYPGRVFDGQVSQVRIAGKTTNNVVTYTVVVGAQNPQQKLLPGMTATVRIITGTRENVLRVPNDAVRFTPPKDLNTTGREDRPNRDEAIVASISEQLQLTPEQKQRFQEGLAATRQSDGEPAAQGDAAPTRSGRRGEAGAGEGRPQRAAGGSASPRAKAVSGTEQRRGRVSKVLEPILTEEQRQEFRKMRDVWRDTTRPADVWQETPKGLKPQRIILGLADESHSEVLRGEVKEGDKVVVRARRNGSGGSTGAPGGMGGGQRGERGERGPR